MSKSRQTVCVTCDADLVARIDAVAKAYDISRDEAARQLIEVGLDAEY